jgi:hypothetical protein
MANRDLNLGALGETPDKEHQASLIRALARPISIWRDARNCCDAQNCCDARIAAMHGSGA